MGNVAVAWQIYQWTHSATALGLVGLLAVIPLLVLSLPAGVVADRLDRIRVIQCTAGGTALLAALLGLVAAFHSRIPDLPVLRASNDVLLRIALTFEKNPEAVRFDQPVLPIIYVILFLMATLRVLGWPSGGSIIPRLVPARDLSNAITWNSSALEVSSMTGPAVGGFLVAWFGYSPVYFAQAGVGGLMVLLLFGVRYLAAPVMPPVTKSLRDFFAGAVFIWQRKVILAASGLDMFAVLLGGAIALLPMYAEEILHVGPIGLGWLRAAPSIGACAMALWLAHRRPMQRPGVMMVWTVVGFGVAIIVFGVSQWFWLSLLALFFTGVFDNVSVVVRHTLVQLLTPDSLRGRVTSMNQIFIGSSNSIGTLRAGLMAAWIGPVGAVVWGGIGTIAIALMIGSAVPKLRGVPPLDQLKPD